MSKIESPDCLLCGRGHDHIIYVPGSGKSYDFHAVCQLCEVHWYVGQDLWVVEDDPKLMEMIRSNQHLLEIFPAASEVSAGDRTANRAVRAKQIDCRFDWDAPFPLLFPTG